MLMNIHLAGVVVHKVEDEADAVVKFIDIGIKTPFIRLNMRTAKPVEVVFPITRGHIIKTYRAETGHNLNGITGHDTPVFLHITAVQATQKVIDPYRWYNGVENAVKG